MKHLQTNRSSLPFVLEGVVGLRKVPGLAVHNVKLDKLKVGQRKSNDAQVPRWLERDRNWRVFSQSGLPHSIPE